MKTTMLAQERRHKLDPAASNNNLLITSEELKLTEQKMQASFLNCSIEEEDLIDNVQPNLIIGGMTDSYSSRLSSEISVCDGFEPSARPTECRGIRPTKPTCSSPIVRTGTNTLQRLHPATNLHRELPNEIPSHNLESTSNMCRAFTFSDPPRTSESKSKLSSSMLDISDIPSYPLVSKSSNVSSETIQTQSITTVASLPKSKDSGFPRSLSCLSLTSGKSYEHVQSKVKEYIRQIKEENKVKRKLTYGNTPNGKCSSNDPDLDESTSPHMLVPIIIKLKDELDEKDRLLSKLQENYDTLLMKYAAAENRLDHLRVLSVGNSFNVTPSEYKKPKASPNVLLLPNLYGLQNASNKSCSRGTGTFKPETYKQQTKVDQLPLATLDSCADSMSDDVQQLLSESIDIVPPPLDLNTTNDLSDQIESDPFGYLADSESLSKEQMSSVVDKKLPIEVLNFQQENPYVKVKRWQESLPNLDFIDPSNYEQVNCDRHIDSKLCREKREEMRLSIIANDNENVMPFSIQTENKLHQDQAVIFNIPKEVCEVKSVSKEKASKSELPISHQVPECYQSTSLLNNQRSNDGCCTTNQPTHSGKYKDHGNDALNINLESEKQKKTITNHHASTSVHVSNFQGSPLNYSNQWSVPSRDVAFSTRFLTEDKTSDSVFVIGTDVCKQSFAHKKYLPPLSSAHPKMKLPSLTTKLESITKKHFVQKSAEPVVSVYEHVSKDVDSDSLCRKRIIGQKVRQILFEYLKNSNDSLCNCKREQKTAPCSCHCTNIPQIIDSGHSLDTEISFRDKNVRLSKCLDEMNECAQKLRGKSEAIMKVLSEQLKES